MELVLILVLFRLVVKVKMDSVKFVDMRIVRLTQSRDFVSESELFIIIKAEITSRMGNVE